MSLMNYYRCGGGGSKTVGGFSAVVVVLLVAAGLFPEGSESLTLPFQLPSSSSQSGRGGGGGRSSGDSGSKSGEHASAAACPQQRQLVQAFVDRFNAYWRTGDANKIGSLYDNFTVFVNHADNSVIYGPEAVANFTQPVQNAYPLFTDYLDSTLGTQDCTYLVKYGHFVLNPHNNTTPYTCNMVLKKQPPGSVQPYLVIRDDIKFP